MAVARQYRLLSVLGQGGFGTVYRARMLGEGGFSKLVALKVLNPEYSNAGDLARRLRDEARVLGLVQHRAIVKVDSLLSLDGRWTVVMEYVEGRDLRTILERGPIPLGPALEIAAEVASALGAAYSANGPDDRPLRLLHRDIKPGNICVTGLGEVKVLDFGIARAEFSDRESTTHSQSFGTPDYMAPERFIYENGPEADIYALGATLYEMLRAERLGRASPRPDVHVALIGRRLEDLASRLGPAQGEIIALLGEMLSYEAKDRPGARDVERRLLRMRHGSRDALLRDWAEATLPPLVAIQEAREDAATGTLLNEQVEAAPVEAARSSWPSPASAPPREANTYALAATPAPPTLVAADDTPAPSPPTLASSGARRAALGAAAVLLVALGVWGALRVAPPTPAPVVAPPVAPTETLPVVVAAPETPAVAPVAAPSPAPAASPPKAEPSPKVASPPKTESSPKVETSPKAEAAPAGDGPVGAWEGSANGRPLDLALKGSPGALRGTVVISYGANSLSSPVKGSFDAASGALSLEDTEDTPDAGRYSLKVSEDGSRMSGYFELRSGGGRVAITATKSR